MLLSLLLAVIEQGDSPTRARKSLLQTGSPAATAPVSGMPQAPATGGAATPAPASPGAGLPVTTPGTTPSTAPGTTPATGGGVATGGGNWYGRPPGQRCGSGGTGRRTRLRALQEQSCRGSSPLFRTNLVRME